MKTKQYRSLLKSKGIHIAQVELYLSSKLGEFDKFFMKKSAEFGTYVNKIGSFQKGRNSKIKDIDQTERNLNENIEGLLAGDIEAIESTDKLMADYEAAIMDSWTEKDKAAFKDINDDYLKITLKNNMAFKIALLVGKNQFMSYAIEFALFCLSYWLAYPIKKILLPLLFPSQGEIIDQFIYAIIIYFSARIIIDFLKKALLHWRVKQLHKSFLRLLPLIESAKQKMEKK
ncbi:hypothetical protein ASE92_11800 [Pedobacter sp. Leaf41]|uniref:hypothetical protein n=1 Tax=Pedobacter sp. Leaf41 TaxID=1736218 RepID=UPI000702DAF2|nr:hypothetical protein [Pedobacter sp. Leaf41]KQN34288.1 hypothetical protein ASE92_11800 [Pedobacter sp. Leaf41]